LQREIERDFSIEMERKSPDPLSKRGQARENM
jgi:hypothetical protein